MANQVMSIIDEVDANQKLLRSRLAGAISTAPDGVSVDDLPSVPLIDLSKSYSLTPSDRKAVASEIRKACTSSGFFQISNHGVSDASISGILGQAETFFQKLTPAEKDALHIRHSKIFRGYEAGGDTYVNPDDNNDDSAEVETKEGVCPEMRHCPPTATIPCTVSLLICDS
jgi:isopenicillin N synthase-like dioxygenase